MYGLKQSPRMWQQHFASVAASLGFERLKSDSNLYFHPERRCYMLCYVDDLIFGDKKTTEFLFSELQKQLCLRSEGVLEPGTSISFLGRCITRREDSIEMSMPTSYIDEMLEQLDMVKCRHAATPGTDALRKLIDSEELLFPEDHKLYRRIVGQLLWLSSIRPDIQFAVKETVTWFDFPDWGSSHENEDFAKVLGRYQTDGFDTSTEDHSAFQADDFWHRHLCGLRLGRLCYFTKEHFRRGFVLSRHSDHFSESDTGYSRTLQRRGRTLRHRTWSVGKFVH